MKLGLVNLSAQVIVPSVSGRDTLEAAGVRRPIGILPNPIDEAEFRPLPASDRDATVAYLGWLLPAKGIDDLIAAFALVAKTHPDARLHSYGPYGAERVRRLADQRGIGSLVTVGEWIEGREKAQLLGRCKVLALPSYSEGFPVVLLEAMASGTPCVATYVGGIPDAVTDTHEGFLVEPGDVAALADRIARLLDDGSAWSAMSAAALQSAHQYGIRVVGQRLVALYSGLVARRPQCRTGYRDGGVNS
jgi:glycosyltransferase involved in cell wall biosynthesis